MTWQTEAACEGRGDLDWFFVRYGRLGNGRALKTGHVPPPDLRAILPPDVAMLRKHELGLVAEMKALCDSCPVQAACRVFALTPPVEADGVWGGVWMDASTELVYVELSEKLSELTKGDVNG